MAAYTWEGGSGTYTLKADGTAVATLSGLASSVSSDDFWDVTEESGTPVVKLVKANLEGCGESVTLTVAEGNTATLKLADDSGNTVDSPFAGATAAESWDYSASQVVYTAAGTDEKWTLDGNTIKHQAKVDGVKQFTVTGLKFGTTTGVSFKTSTDPADTVIEVAEAALDQTKTVTLTKANDTIAIEYSLALADDVSSKYVATGDATLSGAAGAEGTENEGVVTVDQPMTAGYAVEDGKIVYKTATPVTLATVKGLKAGATIALDGTNINIKDGALTAGSVTLEDGTSDAYTLKLVDANDQEDADNKFGGVTTDSATWSVETVGDNSNQSVTATYKAAGTTESWTLDTAEDSETKNKKITYAAATGLATLAVIEGLKTGTTATSCAIDGITVGTETGGKKSITLADSVFNESVADGTVVATLSEGTESYKLAVSTPYNADGTIALDATDISTSHSVKVKQTWTAGYSVEDGTTIKYNVAPTEKVLATISGLTDSLTELGENVTLNEKVITLGAAAFDKSSGNTVTINNETITGSAPEEKYDYTLALTATEGTEENEWKATNAAPAISDAGATGGDDAGKATITQTMTPGYVAKEDDSEIKYEISTSKTLATITGLKDSAVHGENFNTSGATFVLDNETNTVQLTKDAFNTTSATITLENEEGSEYKLQLGTVSGEDGSKTFTAAEDNTLEGDKYNKPWTVSDTKAVYNPGTPAKWTLDTAEDSETKNTKITFTAAAAGTGVHIMITGYAGTLTDDDINTHITVDDTADTDGKYKISIDKTALGTPTSGTKVKFDTNSTLTGGKEYKFALGGTGDAKAEEYTATDAAPTMTNASGTVTVTQAMTGNYILNDDKNEITYTTDTSKTLATLSGLKSDAAASKAVDGTFTDSSVIAFNKETKVISLKEGALPTESLSGNETVSFTDNAGNCTLQLVKDDGTAVEGGKFGVEEKAAPWFDTTAVNDPDPASTTVTFKAAGTTAGWTLATEGTDASKKLTYSTATFTDLATITGLRTGLTATAGAIEGISIAEEADDGKTVISLQKSVLATLDDPATAKTVATLSTESQTSYKLAFDANGTTADNYGSTKGAPTVGTVSGGEADITRTLSAGYESDGTKIDYKVEGSETIAKISGLATNASGVAFGTGTANAKKTITLTSDMLPSNSVADNAQVKIEYKTGFNKDDFDFRLALDSNVAPPKKTVSNEELTVDADGKATLKGTLSAGWTKTDDTHITYSAEKANQTLATISGLKTGAEVGDNKDIKVDASSKKIIILKTDHLGGDKISISNANDYQGNAYTYALQLGTENAESLGGDTVAATWKIDGTTATYMSEGVAEKWTLEADGSVKYHAATPQVLATITGLKSGLTVAAGGQSIQADSADVITFGTGEGANNIIIKNGALNAKSITLTNSNGGDYALKLDEADTTIPKSIGLSDLTVTLTGSSTKTATVTGKHVAGYAETDATHITYSAADTSAKTLAKVSGLGSGANATSGTGNISVAKRSDKKGDIVINLQKGSLGTGAVTLLPQSALGGNAYFKFTGSDADVPASADGVTLGFKDGDAYWAKTNGDTTAYYNVNTAEGWTIDTTTTTSGDPEVTEEGTNYGKRITYTPAKTTTLATLKGLKADVEAVSNAIDGITLTTAFTAAKTAADAVTDNTDTFYSEEKAAVTATDATKGVITLDKRILGASNVNLEMGTLSDGTTETDYKLALTSETDAAKKVPTEAVEDKALFTTGTTTEYKDYAKEFWTLAEGDSPTSITYNKPTDGTVIATISGLEADFDASNITITGEGTPADPYVFTLNAKVLGTKNVTITPAKDTFAKLALSTSTATDEKVSVPVKSGMKWSFSNGTATYACKITQAGYEANADGSEIVYTGTTSNYEIAKIKGLKTSGLTVSSDGAYIGVKDATTNVISEGLKLGTGEDAKKVTLTKDVLDTVASKDVEITSKTDDYTLALDSGVPTSITEASVWRVDGTDAVYKKITPAHYTLDTTSTDTAVKNKKITYTAEADNIDSGNDDSIIATIHNLKSGLTVNANNTIEGITVGTEASSTVAYGTPGMESTKTGTATNGTITLSKDVLGTNATKPISVTYGDEMPLEALYMLELAESDIGPKVDSTATPTWTVTADGDNATATLKGKTTAGWTKSTQTDTTEEDYNTIIYTAAKSGATFATVTGLKKGITAAKLNANTDNTNRKLTLTTEMLGTASEVNITTNLIEDLPGYAAAEKYTFALDSGVPTSTAENTQSWFASSGTYTYKDFKPAYYTISTDSETANTLVTYTERDDEGGTNLVTISGEGLKANLLGTGVTEGTSITGIEVDSTNKKITFSKNVLQADKTKTVTVNAEEYTVELPANIKPVNGADKWTIDKTDASNPKFIYGYDTTAGWTFDAETKTISYNEAKTTPIFTIQGLNKDTTLAQLAAGAEVTVTSGKPTKVTLNESLFKDKTVTLTDGADGKYTDINVTLDIDIAANSTLTKNPEEGVGWKTEEAKINNVTTKVASLYNGHMPKGYTVTTDEKTLTYVPEVEGTELVAQLNGLKTNLTVKTGKGTIDGIKVESDKITLSKGVLNAKDVEFTTNEGSYQLALDKSTTTNSNGEAVHSATYVDAPELSQKWALSGTSSKTATLTETTSAGYTVDGNKEATSGEKIVYSKEETLKTTITNLNKDVKVSSDKKQIGIQGGTDSAPTYSGITLTLQDNESYGDDPDNPGAKRVGTITLDGSVLNEKNVVLTNNASGTTKALTSGSYKLGLASGSEASVEGAKWTKTEGSTTATYGKAIGAGYHIEASNPTTIKYLKDPSTEVLLTLTGLNAEVAAAADGSYIDGVLLNEATFDSTTGKLEELGTVTLDKSILTDSAVKLGANDNYKLALANEEDCASGTFDEKGKSAYWSFSKSKDKKSGIAKLLYGMTESWTLAEGDAPKEIKYTADQTEAVLTLEGLNPNLTLDENKSITGLDISGLTFEQVNGDGKVTEKGSKATATTPKFHVSEGSVVLSDNVLVTTGKDVKLTNANGGQAEIAVDGSITEAVYSENYWYATGNGKAIYRFDTTAGYKPTTASDTATLNTVLKYTGNATTTLATLAGLKTSVTTKNGATNTGSPTLDGIEVDTTTDEKGKKTTTITLTDKDILGSKVTLTRAKETIDNSNDEYKIGTISLGLGENVSIDSSNSKWYVKTEKNKTKTATFREYSLAGYSAPEEKKGVWSTASKAETAGNIILTIKGLNKNITQDKLNDGENPLITLEGDFASLSTATTSGTVKIEDTGQVLGTTSVTLTGGTYKYDTNKTGKYSFSFDESVNALRPVENTPQWFFTTSGGKATLKKNVTKGFELGNSSSGTNDVLTYKKADTNTVIAQIKNLNTKLKAFNNSDDATAKLENTNRQIYSLATDKKNVIAPYEATTDSTTKITTTTQGATAVTFDAEAKTITINDPGFNKKDITFVNNTGGYRLELGTLTENKFAQEEVTEWTAVSGNKSTFKQYDPLYYTATTPTTGNNKIAYTAATKGTTFATITGISKSTTAPTIKIGSATVEKPNFTAATTNDGDKGGVFTIYKDNLAGKNIAITGNADNAAYTLALGNDIDSSLISSVTPNSSWKDTTKKGVAVLQGTRSKGYEMVFGRKNLTYISKDKTNQTIVTVSGLSADAEISADAKGVIKLDKNDVAKKSVTLTTSLGTIDYTLSLNSDVTADTPVLASENVSLDDDKKQDTQWGKVKSSSVSLMGAISDDGYILSESGKSVTYIKETAKWSTGKYKSVSLATIKGVKTTAITGSTFDAGNRKITLTGSELKDSVTVSGGAFSVEFDASFTDNKTITGSGNADSISVSGSGLSINGGKGDDSIDLGSGGNNTFIYTNGDGNDVLTGFTLGDDKLKVTKGTITVEHDKSDVIVKVSSGGTIRLKNAYTKDNTIDGMNLTILDNKGNETKYFVPDTQTMTYADTSASNVLLEDNNYSADAANLSNIVEPHVATYTPYDFDSGLSLTKEDKLTSAAVTYSGDTNKK